METAAYFLDGTCHSKTYWQPCIVYIYQAGRRLLDICIFIFADEGNSTVVAEMTNIYF